MMSPIVHETITIDDDGPWRGTTSLVEKRSRRSREIARRGFWGGIRKNKGESSSCLNRAVDRIHTRKRLKSKGGYLPFVKDEDYDWEADDENGEEEEEGNDDMNGEENEERIEEEEIMEQKYEVGKKIPLTYLRHQNPPIGENPELITISSDGEGTKRNGEVKKQKKEKKKKDDEIERKSNGKSEKKDGGGRKYSGSENYDKRRKSDEVYDRRRHRRDSHYRSHRHSKRHYDEGRRHDDEGDGHSRHHEEGERKKEEKLKREESDMSISDGEDTAIDAVLSSRHAPGIRAFEDNVVPDMASDSFLIKEEEGFTIASLCKDHKGLAFKKVEGTAFKPVSGPLGTAYDPAMRAWFYTDTGNGTVVVATYEGHIMDTIKGFNKPCAIAILKPGSIVAVLDWAGIHLVNLKINSRRTIVDGFQDTCRGLARTMDGNIVTMMWFATDPCPYVTVFDVNQKNKIVCGARYQFYDNPYSHFCLPSFLCSCNELIYISDLNMNMLSSFSYNPKLHELKRISRRDHSDSDYRTSLLKTKYMAGIVADSAHNILVADARGRTIHLVTPSGCLIQTIPFLNHAQPYTSGLALAPTGRVMIACRKANRVDLFDLVPLETETDKLTKGLQTVSLPRHW